MTAYTGNYGLWWVQGTTQFITPLIATTMATTQYGWTGCSEPFGIQWKMRPRKSNIRSVDPLCTCRFGVCFIRLFYHDCAIYVNFSLGRCSEWRGFDVLVISRDMIISIFNFYHQQFELLMHFYWLSFGSMFSRLCYFWPACWCEPMVGRAKHTWKIPSNENYLNQSLLDD